MKMDEQDDPNLPKLESALRGLARDRLFVPPEVDQKVLGAIHENFGQKETEVQTVQLDASDVLFRSKRAPSKLPTRMNPWQRWLPLAASIVIAATMLYFASLGRTLAGDVNRDGAVDVIDALLLADRVRSGEAKTRSWDLNGDGKVDARDSEEILARVVDLERSGS
jgi:hypothetical protein